MEQLKALWRRLNNRQRLTLVGALVAALAGIYVFVNWSRERDFKPLYTGLAAEESGQITARLKERGTEFRLDESTGAVLVPSGQVAELRVELAAAGLPKTGRIGYELFDKMNFGVTEFAEQVNYHRALEGELERSLMAISEVGAARVHVTFAKDSVFADSRQPAKASVMLRLKTGARLAPTSVTAIQHLTASAVEGLDPLAVAVLDMKGALLSRPHRPLDPDGSVVSDAALEHRQRVERDLLVKVNSTLEPLLGPEKYRAALSADVDLTSGESSEEIFDPNRSVMVTQQRTEDSSNPAATGGVPGTPSTLPRPTSRPGGGAGNSVSRRTESIAFQSSRTVKRTRIPQGIVRRLSLSILVDQNVRWEGRGASARRILEAPSPESRKAIRDVVAGVIGFNSDRGDQIIIESLPFDATLRIEPPTDPNASPPPTGPMVVGFPLPAWLPAPLRDPKMLALAVTLLLLAFAAGGLVAARIALRKRAAKKAAAVEHAETAVPAGEARQSLEEAIKSGQAAGQLPAGEGRQSVDELLAQQANAMQQLEKEELAKLQLNTMTTPKSEILIKHVSEQARKDSEGVAQVLRNWLQEI